MVASGVVTGLNFFSLYLLGEKHGLEILRTMLPAVVRTRVLQCLYLVFFFVSRPEEKKETAAAARVHYST
jgi:cbb3-type cytochrome oxidase subunit 3